MHPLFLEAIREKVREELMGFTPEERRTQLLFGVQSSKINRRERSLCKGD
jgi:hypothetical protein